MNGTTSSATDPRLLLEAARVFNAAGSDYRTIAEVVAELALQAKEKADPAVRRQIVGDSVALRLSGRVPGGYQQSLELLKETRDARDDDPDGRLHLLRALARGQLYREERRAGKPKEDPALSELRSMIRKDLDFAFSQNAQLKAENHALWQPTRASPIASPTEGDSEDDLRAVWEDDPAFRTLVELREEATPDEPSSGSSEPEAARPSPSVEEHHADPEPRRAADPGSPPSAPPADPAAER